MRETLPRGARFGLAPCGQFIPNFELHRTEIFRPDGAGVTTTVRHRPSFRTEFAVVGPETAIFRDRSANMCSSSLAVAVGARRRPLKKEIITINNKKNRRGRFSTRYDLSVSKLFRSPIPQRQHIPPGLGRLEKDRGGPLAGRRRKGAAVPVERPERRRLSQLRQSAPVRRQTIVRVRHRSVLAAVHVERGECAAIGR